MNWIKAFLLVILGFFSLLMVYSGINATLTAAGLVTSIVVLVTMWASVDLAVKLVRGPFRSFFQKLSRFYEVGALAMLLFMFVAVALPIALAIWGAATLIPGAIMTAAGESIFATALQRGFSMSLFAGFLAWINFPVSLSKIWQILRA